MVNREKNKLGINDGGTDLGAKVIDIHQSNEYTAVNKHKEGLCWSCYSNKAVGATLVEVCQDCFEKKGKEAILVDVSMAGGALHPYGMCFICGDWKHGLHKLNVRFCETCARRYRKHLKVYNKAGGLVEADPFWKHIKRKFGKDFAHIMTDPGRQTNL